MKLPTLEVPGSGSLLEREHSEALPSWFVVVLVSGLAVVATFGTVGLVLAIAGAMAPVPTLLLGSAATAMLLRSLAPWRIPAARDRAVQVPAALATVVVVGAVALAIRHHAQHVFLDRDPGIYVATARWLATHHSLVVHAQVGAFTRHDALTYVSPGLYGNGHGSLYFQFSHLLPVLMAQARWLGGDRAMFLAPPLLGGLGLLAFYALATRLVRPWIALAALAALAADLVEMHFMRDAYSELATQALLLGALWLLTRRDAARPVTAAFTGALAGATVMARVDGPLYLTVIPIVVGMAVVAQRRGDRNGRAELRAAVWLGAGATLTTAVGYLDVRLRSPQYLDSLAGRVALQYLGIGLLTVGALALAYGAPRLLAWPVQAFGGRVADAAGVLVGGVLAAMWFLRPHLQHTHGRLVQATVGLQRFDQMAIEPTRTYYERSLQWHSWYLGAPALATGILGTAFVVRRIVNGKGGREGLVVASFLSVGLVYLWDPSIFSDQIWVMRRFLPLVIPGFVLFAAVVVEMLWRLRDAPWVAITARVAGGLVVIAMLAWPIHTDWRVRGETTQLGFLATVDQMCHIFGPNAAVVVITAGAADPALPQAVRSFCDTPVAIFDPAAPSASLASARADFENLAREWRRDGRTLFVVSSDADAIERVVPQRRAVVVSATNSLFLQERLAGRPDGFRSEQYSFAITRVN